MIANVINLPHRTDRLEHFKKQAEEQGFEYKVWDGIMLEPTHTAISRSHKQIVYNAQKDGLEEVLIMEDDIVFDYPNAFKDFIKNKPNNYDLYLGGNYGKDRNRDGTIRSFFGLHLYIVHNKFYDKFLSVPEREHLDLALSGKGRYILYNVSKQIAGFSDNLKRETDYNR